MKWLSLSLYLMLFSFHCPFVTHIMKCTVNLMSLFYSEFSPPLPPKKHEKLIAALPAGIIDMLLAAFGSPGFKRPPVTFLRRCVKLFVVPVMAVILHDTSPFTSVETLQRRIGGVSAAPPLSRQRSCYLVCLCDWQASTFGPHVACETHNLEIVKADRSRWLHIKNKAKKRLKMSANLRKCDFQERGRYDPTHNR